MAARAAVLKPDQADAFAPAQEQLDWVWLFWNDGKTSKIRRFRDISGSRKLNYPRYRFWMAIQGHLSLLLEPSLRRGLIARV
jgi:hypothetical protein